MSLLVTNLDTKNSSDKRLSAYTSIIPKILILLFDLEIIFIGVFKSHEVCIGHRWVYKSILPKNLTLAIECRIADLWVLKYQKIISDNKNLFGLII